MSDQPRAFHVGSKEDSVMTQQSGGAANGEFVEEPMTAGDVCHSSSIRAGSDVIEHCLAFRLGGPEHPPFLCSQLKGHDGEHIAEREGVEIWRWK